MNRLKQLETCDQSLWLDFLKRSLIETGELSTLISRDGLKGVTSNPSIFEKAIGETDEYRDAIKAFQAPGDHAVSAIYEHLAIDDIRSAADILRPVFEKTGGRDGYISLECSPYLANDTKATLQEASRLWRLVARPNLMVKVPATPAGIPAIRQLIGRGLNINVTLLFSVGVYQQVAEAYLSGLEDLARTGGDLSKTGSVASIFVSRLDKAVDERLKELNDPVLTERLLGKAAIANAKCAYASYKALFAGSRWRQLAASGARTQRLLWASTSTKNPDFKDTLYVESLIGKDTIDTIPPATLDAFRDHGEAKPGAIERDVGAAREILAELERQGISLDAVSADLVKDGVQQFADAFDKMFGAIASQRRKLQGSDHSPMAFAPGSPEMKTAFDAELEIWRKEGRIRQLWAKDKSLWTGTDEDNWLGWLSAVEDAVTHIDRPLLVARDVKQHGFTDIVLLGMGGSSLGPEVLGKAFGQQSGWPRFHMLDSTDPTGIMAVEQDVDLYHTLFIVSSKSGGTLETNIFLDYFYDRIVSLHGPGLPGNQFVAVTDPDSSLELRAKHLHFAHIFHGEPAIGGRYSVLSNFGLVPAAAMGLDIKRILETALPMVRSCGSDVPPAENPGVQLGISIGIAATRFGRDKVTIITSPGLVDLGAWLEQLLAESTGKQGRGLIPLVGEPLTTPEHFGADRFFVYLALTGEADATQDQTLAALERAGHPVVRITVKDLWHIGQEFFRWELAISVAGSILGVNPFDQPDVEASKTETRVLIDDYEAAQAHAKEEPLYQEDSVSLFADSRDVTELGWHDSLTGYLTAHFDRIRKGDYVALLAYIEHNGTNTRILNKIRAEIRDRTLAATCLGFGPGFQHSTGQAFKGGPNSGVFLQLTCDGPSDITVPGHRYSFGVVKAVQARTDLHALSLRGRRCLRIHFADVGLGLDALALATVLALESFHAS